METKKPNIIPKFNLSILFFLVLSLSFNCLSAQENSKTQEEEEDEIAEGKTMCGGVERWSEKVLVDALENTINFTPINTTVNNLVNLVTPTPSSSMPRYAGVEDKTYKFVCNVTIKKSETDNDYHLVLSDGTNTMIGEIPDPTCSAAASSAFVNQYLAGRNFVDTYIGPGNVSNINIAPVEVYGVAFVDPPHGQTGAAPNNLEIHPILSIQFAQTTGINMVEQKVLSVNVSPNPFKENLKINILSKTATLKKCTIQFYDLMANKVAEFDLNVNGSKEISQVINTTNLAPGTYIYRVVNDGKPIYDGKLISLPTN